jgi:hypothetical protein
MLLGQGCVSIGVRKEPYPPLGGASHLQTSNGFASVDDVVLEAVQSASVQIIWRLNALPETSFLLILLRHLAKIWDFFVHEFSQHAIFIEKYLVDFWSKHHKCARLFRSV